MIQRCIGHGEFGKVYEGKATYGIESPVSVAVKVDLNEHGWCVNCASSLSKDFKEMCYSW